MRVRAVLGCFLVIAALTACADDGEKEESASAGAEAFETQAERGQSLYGRHCASCHGASGQGSDEAPPVVGLDEGALPRAPRDGAVRQTEFVTVADVAGFVVENMPPTDPGGLSTQDYLAILAFDLKANGITLEQELDLELAETLTIPR